VSREPCAPRVCAQSGRHRKDVWGFRPVGESPSKPRVHTCLQLARHVQVHLSVRARVCVMACVGGLMSVEKDGRSWMEGDGHPKDFA